MLANASPPTPSENFSHWAAKELLLYRTDLSLICYFFLYLFEGGKEEEEEEKDRIAMILKQKQKQKQLENLAERNRACRTRRPLNWACRWAKTRLRQKLHWPRWKHDTWITKSIFKRNQSNKKTANLIEISRQIFKRKSRACDLQTGLARTRKHRRDVQRKQKRQDKQRYNKHSCELWWLVDQFPAKEIASQFFLRIAKSNLKNFPEKCIEWSNQNHSH